MPYDAATQTHEPLMLDGEELKIGDEVIIARQPEVANILDDTLWSSPMLRCVGKTGTVTHIFTDPTYVPIYGSPLITVRIPGEGEWAFRLS